MSPNLSPQLGRPNQQHFRVVQDALMLFKRQQPDAAIALLQQNNIPLSVVERVILQNGPRRRSQTPVAA